MNTKKVFGKLLTTTIGLLFIWLVLFGVDYWRVVKNFEKPFFSFQIETQDDGGSGSYHGLGYTYLIKGNFMPLDEYQGVTNYHLFLFGYEIKSGLRD